MHDLNFHEAFKHLADYSCLYKVPNVDIFIENVLEAIPNEWKNILLNLSFEEIKEIPFGYSDDSWSNTLLEFLSTTSKLSEYCYQFKFEDEHGHDLHIPDFIKRKTPFKKLEQIKNMAIHVKEFAEKYNCRTLIDIGSGLGYLDQIVHHNFGLITIGFESDLEKSQNAKQRVEAGTCNKGMHHINQEIEYSENCKTIIVNAIKNIQSNITCECGEFNATSDENHSNVIMVGLHSCGNLMHSMMKLFYDIPEIKVFLCASCCYHKFNLSDFPISKTGKAALVEVKKTNDWDIPVTGLRLGCQITRNHWIPQTKRDFVRREICLFHRAVMQVFLKKENLIWKKPKRHLMKGNNDLFDEFVALALSNISLNGLSKEYCISKLNDIYMEKKLFLPHIRILSLLQMLLQPVWEGVIIADCIAFLKEASIESNILVLCEKEITPRNLIICGIK